MKNATRNLLIEKWKPEVIIDLVIFQIIKKSRLQNETKPELCNPEVIVRKGELQILGWRDESQHIVG